MDVAIGVVLLFVVIALIIAIRVSITTKAANARSAREKQAAAHFLNEQNTVTLASAQHALESPPPGPTVTRYGVDDPPPPPPPGW